MFFLYSKVKDYSRTQHLAAGALLLWVSVRITRGSAPSHRYYSTPQRCRQSLPVCVSGHALQHPISFECFFHYENVSDLV